jgi:hypothetical protein
VSIQVATYTVGTTPVLIHQTDADGCHIFLHQEGNHTLIGPDSTTVATDGYPLHAHVDFEFEMPPTSKIYAVTGSGTAAFWKFVHE